MTPNEATTPKQFAVNWNNHMNHVRRAFDDLLTNSELTDCTLYAEGRKIGAHRVLLSACSTYFGSLFREFPNEKPVVVLKGISYSVLLDILKFIYNGEVSIEGDTFETFLQAAEFLQISGLTEGAQNADLKEEDLEEVDEYLEAIQSPPKRKRVRRGIRKVSVKKDEDNTACQEEEDLIPIFGEDNPDTQQFTPVGNGEFPDEINIKVENEEPYKIDTPKRESEDRLKCPICFKVFSHPYSLHHHKPVHSGGTKCPICHVVLSRKYNLKMHMRSRHNVVQA